MYILLHPPEGGAKERGQKPALSQNLTHRRRVSHPLVSLTRDPNLKSAPNTPLSPPLRSLAQGGSNWNRSVHAKMATSLRSQRGPQVWCFDRLKGGRSAPMALKSCKIWHIR